MCFPRFLGSKSSVEQKKENVDEGHMFSESPPISPDFRKNFAKNFEFPNGGDEKDDKKEKVAVAYLRKTCCSFCYNLYKHNCEKAGERCLLSREDDGPWSHHPLATGGKITCPLLWFHVCQLCGATGSVAHTEKHCSYLDA